MCLMSSKPMIKNKTKIQQESTDDKKLIEKKKDIIIRWAQNCLTLQTKRMTFLFYSIVQCAASLIFLIVSLVVVMRGVLNFVSGL